MKTLKKRLSTIEEHRALQQHRELELQLRGRSQGEQTFFCTYGYWPETATELPCRIEFTVRGIKTIVTTRWEDVNKQG
jgi:hypothetical protein